MELSDRRLPLPVDVQIDGSPRDLRTLMPNEQLEIDGLMEGDWKLAIRVGRQWLFQDHPILVQDGALFYVSLPDLDAPADED